MAAVLKNRKAQLEIVALAFLVAGVVTVSSAGLLGVGGGAQARSQFAQNFISLESKIGEVEIFYNNMINIAARNALAAKGYDLDNFCAASVKIDDSLKNSIIDESGKLISQYVDYDGSALPKMKTEQKTGILQINKAGGVTITKGEGASYSYQAIVAYDYPAEFYVREITASVTRGGETPTGSEIIVSGSSVTGSTVCEHKFSIGWDQSHKKKTETFSCNGKIKTISAYVSDYPAHYVDEFVAKTPTLSYLEISGVPAEKILLKEKKMSISSTGFFSTKIPSTVKDSKPNLVVDSIIFNNDPNFKEAKEGDTVNIAAIVKNSGCLQTGVFKVQILESANVLSEIGGDFEPGKEFKFSADFTPKSAGTYAIKVKADNENKVSETNENDNEQTASLKVIKKE